MCVQWGQCTVGFEAAPVSSLFNADQYPQSNTNMGIGMNIYIHTALCPLKEGSSICFVHLKSTPRLMLYKDGAIKTHFEAMRFIIPSSVHALITEISGAGLSHHYFGTAACSKIDSLLC